MSAVLTMLVLFLGIATGQLKSYEVIPTRADWSGTVEGDPQFGVGQTITCNFDSVVAVHLFVGYLGANPGTPYQVEVYEYPGGITPVAYNSGVVAAKDHDWLIMPLRLVPGQRFVKGKEYLFKFTRLGDSIHFYYNPHDPYGYGMLITPGLSAPVSLGRDLCMRVYGLLNGITADFFSVQIHSFSPGMEALAAALNQAKEIGIRWLGDDLGHWDKWAEDTAGVLLRCSTWVSKGFQIRGYLAYGRNDPSVSSGSAGANYPVSLYPPRNLWAKGDSNYWASYCRTIMRALDTVKFWAVWGEPNATWFWRDPDPHHYGTPDNSIDTPRERCSLYVRMCFIAESVARELGYGQKVIAGYVWRLTESDGGCSGMTWLRDMFDLARRRYGGVKKCFDIVSVNPYMHRGSPGNYTGWFRDDWFHRDLNAARQVMKDAGHPDMELWVTEIGWPRWDKHLATLPVVTDTITQAHNLCQFLVSALARQGHPGGGYDRVNWYELTSYRDGIHSASIESEGMGLLDTFAQRRLPQFWALAQVIDRIQGKRFNGIVVPGDSVVASKVRIYEFEDPLQKRRLWVAWRNRFGQELDSPPVRVKIPVRSDSVIRSFLAYNAGQVVDVVQSGVDGWLAMDLFYRPVFLSEMLVPVRPELRVDSVKVVPHQPRVNMPFEVRVWVKNTGNRATPGSQVRYPIPTRVRVLWNGEVVGLSDTIISITPGATRLIRVRIDTVPVSMAGWGLLSATVNSEEQYVELNRLDDNTGYQRLFISR